MPLLQSNGYFENPYFSKNELKCKGSGELQLAPGFLGELIHLRQSFGFPMVPTSCCRSPEHNEKEGGHYRSLHLTVNEHWNTGGSLAIDISTIGWEDGRKSDLENKARSLGWSVGVAKTFIHLDKRIQVGLPQREWAY